MREISEDYWRLLENTGDYWRLLEITGDYWRLLEITIVAICLVVCHHEVAMLVLAISK